MTQSAYKKFGCRKIPITLFSVLKNIGKMCSRRGGLIIYLKENLKYKMLDMSLKSNIWEGQFIEIYGDSIYIIYSQDTVIDNIIAILYESEMCAV